MCLNCFSPYPSYIEIVKFCFRKACMYHNNNINNSNLQNALYLYRITQRFLFSFPWIKQ